MGEAVAAPQIRAVEIHDLDERNVLAFDLQELLDALGERAFALDWIVTDCDPVTEDEEVAAFADAVYKAQTAAPRTGVRLTSSELIALADKTLQTIDGQFIGIPPDTPTPPHQLVDLGRFPTSDAALFWIVITKSEGDVALIRRRFRDVRESDRTLELGFQLGP